MKQHECTSFISLAKNQGLKRQIFANQAYKQESKISCVDGLQVVWHKLHEMNLLSSKSCEIELLIKVNKCFGQVNTCSYLPDSGRNRKVLYHKCHSIEALTDNMHVKVFQTHAESRSVAPRQLVVETMIDAIISQKKW